MEDTTRAECCRCGDMKECKLISDPFTAEVFPEDGPYPEEWFCEECADARRDDI